MKKLLSLILIIICASIFTNSFAQKRSSTQKRTTAQRSTPKKSYYSSSGYDYKSAIGLKSLGITYKTFIKPNRAIELVGSYWGYRATLDFAYEFHHDIESSKGLKWYIGPAAYVGMYNYDRYYKVNGIENGFIFGVGGIIGLDYKFKEGPFNVSLDWQPSVEFVSGEDYLEHSGVGFGAYWVGAAVRYTF
jgi:hypothetical protein